MPWPLALQTSRIFRIVFREILTEGFGSGRLVREFYNNGSFRAYIITPAADIIVADLFPVSILREHRHLQTRHCWRIRFQPMDKR